MASTEPGHIAGSAAAVAAAAAAASSAKSLPRVGKRGAPQAFARKLYEILTTEADSVIAWNADGTAFHVRDVESFSEETLTKYYRHSKFSSFQRQLNLYSFRKIVKGADAGGYAHPMFRRDRPDDLYHVRRSISGSARYAPSSNSAASKATAAAAAAARRGCPRAPAANTGRASSKAVSGGGGEWAPPRAHKSNGASRRVSKLSAAAASRQSAGSHRRADHKASPAMAALSPDASAGERSPWTSGESSDSDVSLREAGDISPEGTPGTAVALAGGEDSSDESDADLSDAEASGGKNSNSSAEQGQLLRRHKRGAGARQRAGSADADRQGAEQGCAGVFAKEDGDGDVSVGACGTAPSAAGQGFFSRQQQRQKGGARADARGQSSSQNRTSPFNFIKKTLSFMDRSNSRHHRTQSTCNVDMSAGDPQEQEQQQQQPAIAAETAPSSSVSSAAGAGDLSHLMVDTSAAARAAAAGVLPSVTVVTDGRLGVDPTTAAGNKLLMSSPITPKSSIEAAAAAAAAMPPPPKREQREELGLVEQLTNMVEVFDICDLLRKVSNSNSSRLDKHGGIVKPFGQQQQPHHLRNMSVDTDQGLPQSPQARDAQSGLGSLASMELVRDSSKDWDTLMAGSADVSDLGSTMVQSVAEFFSF